MVVRKYFDFMKICNTLFKSFIRNRKNTLSICLLIALLFLATSVIYSQTDSIRIEHISFGKDFTDLRTIFQDSEGYLWFATQEGIDRYDGYELKSYHHIPGDTTSLNNAVGNCFYEDKSGTLWIITSNGLDKFDRLTNSFTNYLPDTSNPGLNNYIYDMVEDQYGIFWVSTGNGIFKFDKATGKFISLGLKRSDPGDISDHITGPIFIDRVGLLWFGTRRGLDRFDYKTGKFLHYWTDPEKIDRSWQNVSQYWITSICQDSSGTIWLGTRDGLIEFNQTSNTFTNYLPDPNKHGPNEPNAILKICYKPTGSLWIKTENGLYVFDTKLKQFTHTYFPGRGITAMCIDRSGIIWVCAHKPDIYKIFIHNSPVKRYFPGGISCVIYGGKGIFWIDRSRQDWVRFDAKTETFIPNLNPKFLLLGDDFGDRWFNKPDKGTYRIDQNNNITYYYDSLGKKFTKYISEFLKTPKGIWCSVDGSGLYFLNFKTKTIDLILKTKDPITNIYKDSFGFIWYATAWEKLYRYNPKNDSLSAFTSSAKNPKSISGRLVFDIHEDIRHRLWMATNDGLNRFDRSTNSFIHFTENEGLSGNSIYNILEDRHGNLWLGTNNGISKFNPETNQFNNYAALQGISPEFPELNFAYKASNGEMFFKRSYGFIRFHPDSIKENQFIPPIAITSFQLFEKPIPFGKEIKLPYDKNFLSFEFAALSFTNPERNQYAYKMEGIDKDWVYSGTRRYVSYPNLSPGEYVFRVKGSNNDGIWNEAGTSLLIIISPPWWKSTWAYIFYGLVFVLAVYSIRRYELNRVNLKNQVKLEQVKLKEREETDKMKSRFFANISHEFRTPLTLINGPIEKILSKYSDEEIVKQGNLIKRNANRLLGLINQLLDLSKLEAGKLKLKTTKGNIVLFIKGITMSFESAAERKDILLNIESPKEEIEIYFDKDKMAKVLSNILSNAFKFTTEGGRITVWITECVSSSLSLPGEALAKPGSNVEIKIKDTGIGISEEELPKLFDRFYQVDSSQTREYEGSGLGLALTKELVELHKGTIKVNSKLGKGSEFIIELPVGREHLKNEEIVEAEEKEEPKFVINNEKHVPTITDKIGKKESFDGEKDIILIVEDNKDVREYIKDSLIEIYHVEEAVNGEKGVIKAGEIIPDLIISDIMMPKMDGNELTKRVKNDERTSHIPVILLTAKAEQQSKLEGLETGANDYLIKPFDTQELLIRIKNLISIRKKLQAKFSGGKLIFKKQEKRISLLDEKFLNKAFEVVETHLSEANFSIEQFSEEIGMGRVQLHRKLKALTGKSASLYLRSVRLSKAKDLIEEKRGNISEIAYSVGFSSPTYFTRCFKEEFGYLPSKLEIN